MNIYSFGDWTKQRRKFLRLTQREMAEVVHCSLAMIKKIEADERHPSSELAGLLADCLQVGAKWRDVFVTCARGHHPVDNLPSPRLPIFPSTALSMVQVTNLPIPTTPFFGRSAELIHIQKLLDQPDGRLLTLLGPGGIGKTRLALEAARLLQNDFTDGVVFVPLTAVSDPNTILPAIANAMNLSLITDVSVQNPVEHYLHGRSMLLLLDNFEQLTAKANILAELLANAPQLKLLVTSRERLNLAEEWVFPVPELDEASALFNHTAIRVNPDFSVQVEETAVAHICQLVGSHPLAVELAASWTRMLSCTQIAEQIQQNFDFLHGGPHNAPARHRSLRALFDHTWHLLNVAEQNVLAKVSVFRGGFRPEQAAVVAQVDYSLLLSLVDKSLVKSDYQQRLYLHELTRQYAAVKLDELNQTETARTVHFTVFATLATTLATQLIGSQALTSFARIEEEQDNFGAALTWGLETGQPEAVLAIAHDLFPFWLRSGQWQEGERWMETAVAQMNMQDNIFLCFGLNHLGVFAALQGRFTKASTIIQRAYQMARRLEEPLPLAVTLNVQGKFLQDQVSVIAAYEEAIAICRENEAATPFAVLLNQILWMYGDRLLYFGLFVEAQTYYEESLARFRAVDDVYMIAYPLGNLGRIALQNGRLQEAYDLISESVLITRRSDNRSTMSDWLYHLGKVQLYLGQLDEAEVNLQEALHLFTELNSYWGPSAVLSNLSFLALERGDLNTAASRIQESFGHYRQQLQAAHKLKRNATASDFSQLGDAVESIIHAGLLAYAQGDWQKAAILLHFVEEIEGFALIRPLQERVTIVLTDLQNRELAPVMTTQISLEAVLLLS